MNTRIIALVAVLGAVPACKKSDAPVVDPEPVPVAPVESDPGQDPGQSNVEVDSAVADLCNMPTAHFGFNSAKLAGDARGALDALAACFTTGPAKGRTIRLVGHADPRGDEEYNFGLGQRRAGSVGDYLEKNGLESARIETMSRGELDATGTEESSWAKDRRVQVFFGD